MFAAEKTLDTLTKGSRHSPAFPHSPSAANAATSLKKRISRDEIKGKRCGQSKQAISLAYATRRADSIQAAKEILLNAESMFPKEALIKYNLACYFCQTGDIKMAKDYLKKAFEIDLNWRSAALEDKDLKPLWESL